MITVNCQDLNHQMPLISVCLNIECKLKRLCCHRCEIEYHNEHLYQLVDLNLISYFLKHKYTFQFESPHIDSKQVLNEIQDFLNNLYDGIDQNIIDNYLQKYIQEYNTLQQVSQYQNHFVEDILKLFRVKKNQPTTTIWNEQIQIIKKIEKHIQNMIEESEQALQLLYDENPIVTQIHSSKYLHAQQDGTLIAYQFVKSVDVCETQTKKQVWKIEYTQYVQSLTLSPNNSCLAILILTRTPKRQFINIYFLNKKSYYWTFEKRKLSQYIIFSQDAQFLFAAGDMEQELTVYSIILKKQIYCLNILTWIRFIVISADTKILSCISYKKGYLYIWNLHERKEIIHKHNTGHKKANSLCVSKDSSIYISSGEEYIKVWKLMISDSNSIQCVKIIQPCDQSTEVCRTIFASEDKFIISIFDNEQILIHETKSFKRVQILQQKTPLIFDFTGFTYWPLISISSDLNLVTCLGQGYNLYIWKVQMKNE